MLYKGCVAYLFMCVCVLRVEMIHYRCVYLHNTKQHWGHLATGLFALAALSCSLLCHGNGCVVCAAAVMKDWARKSLPGKTKTARKSGPKLSTGTFVFYFCYCYLTSIQILNICSHTCMSSTFRMWTREFHFFIRRVLD